MTSVEIYHTTHNQIETRAPIRAMSFATLGGKPYVVAAYLCTPLVTIPLEDLKDGAHIRGKAIAELGYRRNTAARSLVTRRSQTIGVLGSDMSHYGPANTLLGVQQAARDKGYFVSVASLGEVTPAAIKDGLEYFMMQSVDGIVVIVPH